MYSVRTQQVSSTQAVIGFIKILILNGKTTVALLLISDSVTIASKQHKDSTAQYTSTCTSTVQVQFSIIQFSTVRIQYRGLSYKEVNAH